MTPVTSTARGRRAALRARLAVLAGLLAVVAAFAGSAALDARAHPGPDPDRWFHFAVSRQMVHDGLVRTLPQAPDLGWDRAFAEPYFLFHALTSVGYRLGGEAGVLLAARLIPLATLVVLYLFACPWCGPAAGALLTAGVMLTSSYLTPRLFQLRPHLAAVLCLVLLVAGAFKRRGALVFVAAMCFALCYHALYLPLAVLATAFVCTPRPARTMLVAAGLAGLVLGVLGNPYFPANVTSGVQQLRIALGPPLGEPGMEPGRELAPLSLDFFAATFSVGLAAFAAALWSWWRSPRPNRRDAGAEQAAPARALPFLLLTSSAFWLLAIRSPRAAEFAAPLTVLTAAAAFPQFASLVPRRRRALVAVAALALVLAFPGRFLWNEATAEPDRWTAELTRAALEALAEVPAGSEGDLLLNCEWTLGAFVLYRRPELHFLDALHPRLLEFAAPAKYERLRRLKLGLEPDAAGAAAATGPDALGARYVLCDRPALNAQLESDPRVRLLYEDRVTPMRLFELGPLAHPQLASHYAVGLVPGPVSVEDNAITARFPAESDRVADVPVDLLRRFGPGESGVTRCAWLAPSSGELAAHVGARAVSLGGGPHMRLWLNRKLLYSSDPFLPDPRMVQAHVMLPRPLAAGDRLEAAVCRRNAAYWSFALWWR